MPFKITLLWPQQPSREQEGMALTLNLHPGAEHLDCIASINYLAFFFFFLGRRAALVPREIFPFFVRLSPLPIADVLLFYVV